MNKKASARDVIFIAIILFSFALVFFIIHGIANTVVDRMEGIGAINSSNATMTALESTRTTSGRLDYIFFSIYIGLTLGLIITGYLIGGNPLFTVIYFLFVVIAVVISTILSNIWETVSTGGYIPYVSVTVHFPITDHIMLNLPLYVAISGFIGMLAMFAKPWLGAQR